MHRLARFLAFVVVLLGTPLLAAEDRAVGVIERLDATLLEAMKNADRLGYQGRYELLAPVLSDTFNFPLMARIAVGRYWSELDEAQREKLVDAFTRMSIATFAARFNGYSGERFEVLGTEPGARRGTALIRTNLVRPEDPPVGLNYLMHEQDGRWRAVDVYLDAKYSELAVKRSEYTSVIEREGFDGLLGKITEAIAKLKGEAAT
jgi:phospholipid transport system substrate-binding protein